MTAPAQANGRTAANRARLPRPTQGYDYAAPDVLHVAGMLICGTCGDLVANVANATQRHTWTHATDRAREGADVDRLRGLIDTLAREVARLRDQVHQLQSHQGEI